MEIINYIKNLIKRRKDKKYNQEYYQKNKIHMDAINKIARVGRLKR